jgi:hypothetical protein
LKDRRLTFDLERTSPDFSSFVLRTEWQLGNAEGAHVEEFEPNLYRVTVNPTVQATNPQGYQRVGVALQFADRE